MIEFTNMKIFLLLVLVSVTSCSVEQEQWAQYKEQFGKTYKSLLEDKRRFQIFQSNLQDIENHNARYAEGKETYFKGINQFTDLSPDEFKRSLNLFERPQDFSSMTQYHAEVKDDVPESLDWRDKNIFTPVKDQGGCGSCWAFSTVASIESHYALKYGELHELSAQELVDCTYSANYSNSSANYGCQGGYVFVSIQYVAEYGLETLSDYPYTGKLGPCVLDPVKSLNLSVLNYGYTTEDEEGLKTIVATIGPLSAAINADLIMGYSGGIFNNPDCSIHYNHAVNIVGYGSENGTDYWIIRNTWGPDWGENGHFRLARNAGNMCGITECIDWPVMA